MADVFGGSRLPDGRRVLVDCGHGSECTGVQADFVFPTSTLLWRGLSISVPAKIEQLLEERYGPTWQQPRYLDKGADKVEHKKWYNVFFRGLAATGIRI